MACPPNTHLCAQTTLARGLCIPKGEECNRRSSSIRNIPIVPIDPKSAEYGYKDGPDLGKQCYYTHHTMTLNSHVKFENPEEVPTPFSCLTYNIWGLAKNNDIKKLFDLRMPLLVKTLRETNADMLCLQEISSFAYDRLKTHFAEYKFTSEVYPADGAKRRNRGVDVYFLSKYRPAALYIYGLEGVLGYANALMVIEYPNLLVFNLYSQAGSKSSLGQEHKWLHYSRCRYDILESIRDLIDSSFSDFKEKQIIICGDFNFHLDGEVGDWPEMEMIHTLKGDGFVDSYRSVNPTKPGFTEDTDLNKMRWNQKLVEKFFRFDAVLYKGPLVTKKSEVIGLGEECLSQEDTDWFIQKLSEARGGREGQLKYCGGKWMDQLPINPSDHFGVLSTFGPLRSRSRSKSKSKRVQSNTKKQRHK
jgi:exonuclease III